MAKKKSLTRRRFLIGTGLVTATASVSAHSRMVRSRLADIGSVSMKPGAKPGPATWQDRNITVSWLGHSTTLINFYGLNIITDPVLHSRVGADIGIGIIGPKRRVAPALQVDELPRIDLVLLSHAHLDHFDTATLDQIHSENAVTAHRTSDLLDGTSFANKTELKWGQKTRVTTAQGDIEVEAFEVRHWGARWRHDTYRGYNAYILRRGGKAIIFGGDTAFCDSFSEIKSKGPYELAIMPIGAYQPYIWSHCNPEQAVAMANNAGAKYILPIHHTTFRLGRETYTEPLERFETALSNEPERIALRRAGETFLCC